MFFVCPSLRWKHAFSVWGEGAGDVEVVGVVLKKQTNKKQRDPTLSRPDIPPLSKHPKSCFIRHVSTMKRSVPDPHYCPFMSQIRH